MEKELALRTFTYLIGHYKTHEETIINSQETDIVEDIIMKLSEGNTGAISALFEIINFKDNNPIDCIGTFLTIDNMELYGSHLYMLWNDCCKRDIKKTLAVIELFQHGKITKNDIEERIKNVGYGKSFDDLLGGNKDE